MVLVVFLTAAVAMLSVSLIDLVRGDSTRSAKATVSDAAFQAAEAGLDDYTSKLLDDNQFFLHDVALGESTRRSSGGTLVSPGASTPTAWTYGTTWTYPNGKNNWRSLTNGYEYNIQITAPTATNKWSIVVATGRKQGTTSPSRVIEEWLRPSSVSDFQMISNISVSYGSTATTFGKIYANGNINHQGTAFANLYAENSVTGGPTMMNGALKYDSSNIGTVIKSHPINFASFATSLVDISRAAQLSGIYLNDATAGAWQLTFNSDGTVNVKKCNGTNQTSSTPPTCTQVAGYPKPVPSNGAIYVEQSAIIAGGTSSCTDPGRPGYLPVRNMTNAVCVDGRVTVASNQQIIIGDDIGYVNSAGGDDVLGLIAKGDMIVAEWAPQTLNWRAATIAQTGEWSSASSGGSHTTMTFMGSTATAQGGQMSMFDTRNYNYDDSLLYLQPPWFPTIGDAYTVLLFRELPGT
jgi:Tfp pilus assembly protein PilX